MTKDVLLPKQRWARNIGALMLLVSVVFAVAPARAAAPTVPSAPSISSVVAGQRSLGITFSAPAIGSGSVTGYRAEYSTDGSTWTLASDAISSIAGSYTITGLTSETTYYVRVAAKYSGGIGAWGYNWQQVYAVTSGSRNSSGNIVYSSGFGTGGSDAAATNSDVNYTRVRYRMQYTYLGSNLYVDANFNRTLGTRSTYSETFDSVSRLRVPTPNSGFEIQGDISSLDIESNADGVPNGTGFSGRLEIWPWDYDIPSPPKVGGGTLSSRNNNNLSYDDSDTAKLADSYGSFQLHRLSGVSSENQTIFAWNKHGVSTPDIGFGNGTGTHSDWTFNAIGRSNFRLFIYMDKPVTTPASTGQTAFTGNSSSITGTITGTRYVVERFLSSSTWTVPQGVSAIDLLVVGGGGGGKSRHGGGGGAGGFAVATNYAVTPGTTYSVVIGQGGAGGNAASLPGSNGTPSSFTTSGVGITANGGGGGATGDAGGTSGTSSGDGATGYSNVGGAGLSNTCGTNDWCGGGGGGAGGAGNSASSQNRGGNGGSGRASFITGTSVTYAGGGGGSSGQSESVSSGAATAGGSGGSGGGGAGGTASPLSNCSTSTAGVNGTPNTGGGGGGGGFCNQASGSAGSASGGSGGSGIIIVRYVLPDLTEPDLWTSHDTGASSSDNVTKNTTLNFSGTAMAGAVVQLSTAAAGTSPSSGTWTNTGSTCTTASTGAWTCTTGALAAGTYAVRAVATSNLDGLSSTQTSATALALTVDTTAPSSSASISDSHTNTSSVSVSRTASDNVGLASVSIFRSASAALSSPTLCAIVSFDAGTTSSTGTSSCSLPSVDGTYYVYALATDRAGNSDSAPGTADDSVIRDTVKPTVSSFTSNQNPLTTNLASLTFTLTFSENVTDVGAGDFTNTGTAENCVFSPGTDTSSSSRTVTVTGCGDGTVIPRLATNSVLDVASNTGPASAATATTTITRDATKPTVEWTSPSSPSTSRTLSYTLTFSESVSGLAAGDFQNAGAALGCSFSPSASSGTTFTVTVTCTSDGTVVARLIADSVTDGGGNAGPLVDRSADSVTIAAEIDITYDSQLGSSIAPAKTLIGGSITSSPGTPAREGYEFDGWSLTSDGDVVTFPFTHGQTDDFTMYAIWSAETLTITFDSRGGTAVADSETVTGGTLSSLPSGLTRRGYVFDGWAATQNGPKILPPEAHGKTSNFTLFARWVADEITVTYELQGGTGPSGFSSTATTETGGAIASSPGTPTKDGFDFVGWSATDSGFPVAFPYSHNRSVDFTMYAVWRSSSEPNNLWFYPAAGPSDVMLITAPTLMTPGFPRSSIVYEVTAEIESPLGVTGLDSVSMCWYEVTDGSPTCDSAATSPETEFLVTWNEASEEFVKTGTNHYALGTGGDVSTVVESGSFVTVNFKFKISNAMRAGDWVVVVTALDDAGLSRSRTESADVGSFYSVMVRPDKKFGLLPKNGSYTVNDTLVGEYASNAPGDFSISATNFNCAGCDSSHQLTLVTSGDPGPGEVALDCSIGSTLEATPLRVTGSTKKFSRQLTETGETTNKNNKMSCRLIYGGGAKRALVEYSNTFTFGIGPR